MYTSGKLKCTRVNSGAFSTKAAGVYENKECDVCRNKAAIMLEFYRSPIKGREDQKDPKRVYLCEKHAKDLLKIIPVFLQKI